MREEIDGHGVVTSEGHLFLYHREEGDVVVVDDVIFPPEDLSE